MKKIIFSAIKGLFLIVLSIHFAHLPVMLESAHAGQCAGYEEGSLIEIQAQECNSMGDKGHGRTWRCDKNLCEYAIDVISTNEDLKVCKEKKTDAERHTCIEDTIAVINYCADKLGKDGDPKGEKRNECIQQNKTNKDLYASQNEVFTKGLDESLGATGDTDTFFKKQPLFYVHAILLVISLALFGLKKKGFNCTDTSAVVSIVSSFVLVIGELVSLFMMKDKIEKIKKKYVFGSGTDSAGTPIPGTTVEYMDLQKNAFSMLAEEQQIRSDTELGRIVIYSIASAGYIAATILAGIECYSQRTTPCTVKEEEPAKKATDKADDPAASKLKEQATAMSSKAGGVLTSMAQSSVTKILGYACFRIPMTGLLSALSVTMATYSGLAMKKSKDRSNSIKALMERYLGYQPGYFCKSRADRSVPSCYCNDEFGKKDPDKASSETCKAFWSSQSVGKAETDNFNYLQTASSGPSMGCFKMNGEFDGACKCKKYIRKKDGQNSCAKALQDMVFFQNGNAQIPKELDKATSTMLGASGSFANFSTGGGGLRLAASMLQRSRKSLADWNKDQLAKGKPVLKTDSADIQLAFNEMRKNLPSNFGDQMKQMGIGGPVAGGFPSASAAGAGEKALADAKKKIGDGGDSLFYSGGGGGGKKAKGKDNSMQNLFGNDGDNKNNNHVENVPEGEKIYKLGEHAINQSSNTSIWLIISQRYQKSAYNRLFAEEEAIPQQ